MSKGSQRMLMADIARLAGVSSSTVSRALNGNPLIKKDTRERIAEIARSMNYQINVGAANLRKGDVQTVGVLMLPHMQMVSDPFLLSLVGHIADELEKHDINMLLSRVTPERESALTSLVDTGQARGLIIIGQMQVHDQLNALADRGVPLVVWGGLSEDARYCVVGGDNLAGGYMATRHLIEAGCQRIAFLGDTTYVEGAQRHQGYLRAMHELGMPVVPENCRPMVLRIADVRRSIDAWLDTGVRFDGLVATSDVYAMNLISALAQRGIRVPEQVRVVGYDDVAMAEHMHPSLSSIRQPTDWAARAMVENLLRLMRHEAPVSQQLPTELVVRQSSR